MTVLGLRNEAELNAATLAENLTDAEEQFHNALDGIPPTTLASVRGTNNERVPVWLSGTDLSSIEHRIATIDAALSEAPPTRRKGIIATTAAAIGLLAGKLAGWDQVLDGLFQ